MRIVSLSIERFRCIEKLDWKIDGRSACLIGQGDAGKTTILDAIDFVLSPRWTLNLEDNDFFNRDTSQPVVIEITVADLPDDLRSEQKFGLCLRGWNSDSGLVDEPEDGYEPVITIHLEWDSSLEPEWTVLTDRLPEGKKISHRDRIRLGVCRLGTDHQRHLSWTRGSVLAQLTAGDKTVAEAVLSAARAAASVVGQMPLEDFAEATVAAQEAATRFGVQTISGLEARVDSRSLVVNAAGFSLHDGETPLRLSGLGTQRLVAMALQDRLRSLGSLTLVDEIEYGLEPHRLRTLLRRIKGGSATSENGTEKGQFIATTHSPVVTQELPAEDLAVVRRGSGFTSVQFLPENMQATLRSEPDAFLARAIIVCEGKTEVGILRSLDVHHEETSGPFASNGVSLAFGQGTKAPGIAIALSDLGYRAAAFVDGDVPITPTAEEMETAGVAVFQWPVGCAIEDCLASDLPISVVLELYELARASHGFDHIRDCIAPVLQIEAASLRSDISEWVEQFEEAVLRSAFASVAKDRGWFKRIDRGEEVGRIICRELDDLADTCVLKTTLMAILAWTAEVD